MWRIFVGSAIVLILAGLLAGCASTKRTFVPWAVEPMPINKGDVKAKPEGPTLVLDEILAYVDSKIMTLQDVRMEKAFMKVTGWSVLYDANQMKYIVNDPDTDNSDHAVFEELLARTLIYIQAEKLKVTQNAPATTEKEIEEFKAMVNAAGLDYLEFCHRVETTDAITAYEKNLKKYRSLEQYLSRYKVITQFKTRRIDVQLKLGLDALFSEQRDELAAKYPGKNDEELKALLKEQVAKDRLRDWIKDLKERSHVVVVREWDRPDPKVAP